MFSQLTDGHQKGLRGSEKHFLLIILIQAIAIGASAEDVVAIFANQDLSTSRYDILVTVCKPLAEGTWPSWMVFPFNRAGKLASEELRRCFQANVDFTFSPTALRKYRSTGHRFVCPLTVFGSAYHRHFGKHMTYQSPLEGSLER